MAERARLLRQKMKKELKKKEDEEKKKIEEKKKEELSREKPITIDYTKEGGLVFENK